MNEDPSYLKNEIKRYRMRDIKGKRFKEKKM